MAENKAVLKVVAEIQDALKKLDQLNAKIDELRNKDVTVKIKTDEISQVSEALKRVEADIKGLVATIDKINKDVIKPKVEGDQAAAALKKIDAAARKTREELKKLAEKNAIDPLSDAIKKEASEVKREMNKLVSDFDAKARKLNDAAKKTNFKPMSQAAKLMKRDVVDAAEAVIKKFNQLPASVDKTSPAFTKLAAKAKQAQVALKAFKNSANDVKSGTEKMVSSLKKLSSAILSVKGAFTGFVAVLVAKKIFDLGLAATSTAIKFEAMKRAFEAVAGGAEEANEQLGFLRDLSDTLGLKFEGLTQNFLRLTAAAQGTAFEGQLLEDIFTAVSLAAAGLQLSAEDVTGIFFALEQTISKGTVQAEELRRQLGNRLPGAFKLMAQGLKITEAQLSKFLKQGVISAQEGLSALALQMLDTFGSAALANIDSTRSELNRLANTVFDLKLAFANELLPSISNLANRLSDMGEDGEEVMKRVGEAVSRLIDFITFLVSNVDNAGVAFTAFKGAAASAMLDIIRIVNKAALSMTGLAGHIAEGFAEGLNSSILDLQTFVNEGKSASDELESFLNDIADQRVSREESAAALIARTRASLAAKIKAAEEAGTKLTKEELKKRQSAYEDFFGTILKLAEQIDKALRPPDTAEPEELFPGIPRTLKGLGQLEDKLKSLEGQLEEVSQSPVVSQEQIDQADRLRDEIGQIESALRKTSESQVVWEEQSTALQGFGEKIRATLSELINNSQEFRSSFASLSEGSQISIEAMIEDFSRLTESADFTGDDLRRFVEDVSRAFTDAGVTTDAFAKGFEGVSRKFDTSADGMTKSLDNMRKGLDTFKTSKDAEEESVQANIQSVGTLGDTYKGAGEKLEETTVKIDKAEKSISNAAKSTVEWNEETKSLVSVQEESAEATEKQAEATDKAAESTVRWNEATKTLSDATKEQVEETKGAAEAVQKFTGEWAYLNEFLGESAETLDKVGTTTQELGDSLQGVGDAAEKAGEKIKAQNKDNLSSVKVTQRLIDSNQEVGESFDETAGEVDSMREALRAAGADTRTLAEKAGDAKEGMADVSEAAGELAEATKKIPEGADPAAAGIQKVGDAAREAESSVKGTADGIEKISQSAKDLQIPAEFNSQLSELGSTSKQFQDAIAKIADGLSKIAQAAPNLSVPEGFVEFIQALGTAASENSESFAKFSLAFQDLATATTEITAPEGLVEFISSLLAATSEQAAGFEKFAQAFKILSDAMTAIEVNDEIVGHIEAIGAAAQEASAGMDTFATAFKKFADAIAEADLEAVPGQLEAIATALKEMVKEEVRSGLRELTKSIEEFGKALNKAAGDSERIQKALEATISALKELDDGFRGLSTTIDTVLPVFATLVSELGNVEGALEGVAEQVGELISSFQALANEAVPAIEAVGKAVAALNRELGLAVQNAKKLNAELSSMPSPSDSGGAPSGP